MAETAEHDIGQPSPDLLFQRLRARGLNVSVADLIEARTLKDRLDDLGAWPSEPAVVSQIYAPIFAKSAIEQREFQTVFDDLLDQRRQAERRASDDPEVPAAYDLPIDEDAYESRLRSFLKWTSLLLTAVVIIVWSSTTQEPPLIEAPPEDAGEIADVDPLKLSLGELTPEQQILIDGFKQSLIDEEKFWEASVEIAKDRIENDLAIRESAAANRAATWTDGVKTALALLPLIGFLLWWLALIWRQRQKWLRKLTGRGRVDLANLQIRLEKRQIFSGATTRHSAQTLRRHTDHETRVLDPERTIDATLEVGAAELRPVYWRRPMLPEHLVLIDGRSGNDHFVALMQEMTDRLRAEGLAIEVFIFYGDPRACHPERHPDQSLSLGDLARQYGDYRLIICGDGHRLVHPRTGRMRSFAAGFVTWRRRVLFTHRAFSEWGEPESQIYRSGFALAPISESGFAWLAQILTDEDDAWLARQRIPRGLLAPDPLPSAFLSKPEAWLSEEIPDGTDVESGLDDLHDYLGPAGFRWLAATAVYPLPNWGLTLYLGDRIAQHYSFPEFQTDDYLRLARLPWLRHGHFPTWLRSGLLSHCRPEDLQFASGALNELIAEADRVGERLIELEIGYPRRLRHQARSMLSDGFEDDFGEKDDIYVGIVTGGRPDPTDFVLTDDAGERLGGLPPKPFERRTLRQGAYTLIAAAAIWLGLSLDVTSGYLQTAVCATSDVCQVTEGQLTQEEIVANLNAALATGDEEAIAPAFAMLALTSPVRAKGMLEEFLEDAASNRVYVNYYYLMSLAGLDSLTEEPFLDEVPTLVLLAPFRLIPVDAAISASIIDNSMRFLARYQTSWADDLARDFLQQWANTNLPTTAGEILALAELLGRKPAFLDIGFLDLADLVGGGLPSRRDGVLRPSAENIILVASRADANEPATSNALGILEIMLGVSLRDDVTNAVEAPDFELDPSLLDNAGTANVAPDIEPALNRPNTTVKARLKGSDADLQADAFERSLTKEERGDIQRMLTDLGFDTGAPDGVFGDRTRTAIRKWQDANGIEATGSILEGQLPLLLSQSPAAVETGNNVRQEQSTGNLAPLPNITTDGPVAGYRLGPGDQVRVTTFRHEDLSGEFALDGEGRFAMPLVGEIQAGGRTARDLENAIEAAFGDGGYLKDPQVAVEVLSYRPFYVLGQVDQPGAYPYVNGMTVVNAVLLAGGYTFRADRGAITVQRGGSDGERVDVGPTDQVLPGDIITVPERIFDQGNVEQK